MKIQVTYYLSSARLLNQFFTNLFLNDIKKFLYQTSHTFYSTNNKINTKRVKIKNNVKNLQRSKRIQKWMKKSTKISKKSNTTSIISKNN